MCKPELETLRKLLRKDKTIGLYAAKWSQDVVKKEISSIVNSKCLRLESSQLSPEKILNFSFSEIDSFHRDQAPFIRSVLRSCTSGTSEILSEALEGLEEIPDIRDEMALYREKLESFPLLSERQNSCRNCSLIAVIALFLLSYARSEKTNIFQAIVGHAAFAYNIPKRAIETFHQMGVIVSYESIRRALAANANAVEAEMREKVRTHRFFISYDNMNFYEHVRDARMFNQGAQVNYTAGYVCFMRPLNQSADGDSSYTWQNQYLSANLIDRAAVNDLSAEDFTLSSSDLDHRGDAVRHTVSEVIGRYFAKAMCKQKILIDGTQLKPCFLYISTNIH